MSVKIAKYIGFCVYRRSYLSCSEFPQKIEVPGSYDLHDVAHVAAWELYDLQDLGEGQVYWVGYGLCRSCITYLNGRLGC